MTAARIALLPAYEPQELLIGLIEELKKQDLEIIVVNDGSGSGYEDIFTEAAKQAVVLRHEINRGKGAAIKAGLTYISHHYRPPYTVVTVDADGQHKSAEVKGVLDEAERYQDALVLGSRQFTGKVPARSRLGNTLSRYVCRLAGGPSVYDPQTGLRAFSHRLIPVLLKIEGQRYEYEMNMLLVFEREKKPVREVAIETVYLNDNASSHFHTIRDSFRIYREILKFSASSLTAFLVDYGLYCFLLLTTGMLAFANVGARLVSATVNYTLNRKMVFDSDAPLGRSALQYALLAVFILMGNTVFLRGLTEYGMSGYVAKIVTELVFFVFSWNMQRSVIFKKEAAYERA